MARPMETGMATTCGRSIVPFIPTWWAAAQLTAEKAGQTAQASRDDMAAKVAKALADKKAAEERRLAQQQISNGKEEEGAQDSAEVAIPSRPPIMHALLPLLPLKLALSQLT